MTRPDSFTIDLPPSGTSDGDLLAWMGIDAVRWARVCERVLANTPGPPDLIGWFASAIGAGEIQAQAAHAKWGNPEFSADGLADGDRIDQLIAENADLRRQLDDARAEIEKLRRGGRTLGEIIDKQSRELIELADSQDVIGEDGDGDWAVVWDRLHEMKAAVTTLTRERDDARALVVRSGLFERRDCDCVFTRHESDLCGALTEPELRAAGVETDHSTGHDGETCEVCR